MTCWKRIAACAWCLSALALAACEGYSALAHEQPVERARLGDATLPWEAPPPRAATSAADLAALPPVAGTYHFVTPETTTRVKRITGDFEQYSLFLGQPAPADHPFVVLTVGKTFVPQAEDPDAGFRVTRTRTAMLNGLVAREWTGFTRDGEPFTELILTHAQSGGDQMHAIAIARNEEQRKLALEILGSITWQANP